MSVTNSAVLMFVVLGAVAGCGGEESGRIGGSESFHFGGFAAADGNSAANVAQAPGAAGNDANPLVAAARNEQAAGQPLHLKKMDVYDAGVGTNAFGILVPNGWKSKGGVVWNLQEAQLADLRMTFFNPAGSEQLEFFKKRAFYWQPPGTWIIQFRSGSNYLGMEVQPATTDPKEYVQKFFLPRERRGTGARITATEDLPKIAKAAEKSLADGLMRTVRAGRVRLEYRLGGKDMQEDVYVTLAAARSPFNRNVIIWGASTLYSFRAEKGKLDAQTPLFNAMVSSSVVYLQWKANFQYVQQLWTDGQMQAIANAGHISRIIARNADEIRRIYNRSYRRQQRSYDRIHRNFSNYIRGVSDYKDPYSGDYVTVPSGYDHVWVNRFGEYKVSNSSFYDPNRRSGQTWTRATPVR